MKKSLPGPKNLITDVKGILVGSAEDSKLCTGVTVLSSKKPLIAAVDVRGGGPGTKETDMLKLENSIGRADAIVLSGGSAFGLDASSEIQRLLKKDKRGYCVNGNIIPLVPSAIIFDLQPSLEYWKNDQSIWKKLANQAYKNLDKNFLLGSKGAGYGAKTSTLKGGLGSASWIEELSDGKQYTVGAIVINNAVGNPLNNKGPHFLSGYLEIEKEFGGLGSSNKKFDKIIRAKRINNSENQINTIIGIVATDAPLDRANLKRLAIMAHDGISRSIHPSHTPMDGDTIFSVSSNQNRKENPISKSDLTILATRASDCIARACNRAVYEAKSIDNLKPSWQELFKR